MSRPLLACILVAFALVTGTGRVTAQIDVDAYARFLEEHKNMTTNDLLLKYPAGMFKRFARTDLGTVQFGEHVAGKLALTSYERELIGQHSFMVTERLSYPSYNAAFLDAYVKDLPVYISSDAILHALHRSYDKMLAGIEGAYLKRSMESSIKEMLKVLRVQVYSSDSLVQVALREADVYLTVADALMTRIEVRTNQPVFVENVARVHTILDAVNAGVAGTLQLSDGAEPRHYDYSQLKPRGHYTDYLKEYFQCMMWLGRTEIYITPPVPSHLKPTDAEIRRQCMLAVILADLAQKASVVSTLNQVDAVITRFVGEQDNLSLSSLINIVNKQNGGLRPEHLLADSVLTAFQDTVVVSGGEQKILSQMLMAGKPGGEKTKPAAAFMLMGQRFILDSYILSNLVHDKVEWRMMPSPLDAMFALGNDAAAQLLTSELTAHQYAPNLAGLRFLTSTLTPSYWQSSLYATWLNSIRALNPQPNRSSMPSFMQTGAWAQKQLNTQLMSWTELRHDNLLYGKQSYTSMDGCLYPSGYVEPVPALYSGVAQFARDMESFVRTLDPANESGMLRLLKQTLLHIDSTCTTLATMATKELSGIPFSPQEKALIDNWIVSRAEDGCAPRDLYDGIYPGLFFDTEESIRFDKGDFVIADVHTQPTDEVGNMVGKVLHVATGKVNMALVVAADPSDGCASAYVGPVGSFYQHITDDFIRLTDKEWVTLYNDSTVPRPAWVYTYLANANGESLGEPQTLMTTDISEPLPVAEQAHLSVAPNPTSGSATIAFVVPPSNASSPITVQVVSSTGVVVSTLLSGPLVAGNYLTRWDGMTSVGEPVGSGTYYVRVLMGDSHVVQQVVVVR